MSLPCITVAEAIEQLKLIPDQNAKLHAWAPGSYCPVAVVMPFVRDGKALMEINVPPDAALSRE